MLKKIKWLAVASTVAVLAGCASKPPLEPREPSAGHLSTEPAPPPPTVSIPAPVTQIPVLPPPRAAVPTETYTVVVNEVPVKELLFALSRDAAVNVDVHPDVTGIVTMNAIDQTLEQILDRIGRQVNVRYEQRGDTLVIGPDTPFLRTYRVDYVNLSRSTKNTFDISTQISTVSVVESAGGSSDGENNSTTKIEALSNNEFWESLEQSVRAIVEDPGALTASSSKQGPIAQGQVIVNRESGVIVVRANSRQHSVVQSYLDQVMANAGRQVLIQATIVEVQLNDRYRAGIDFSRLVGGGGQIAANLLAGSLGSAPNIIFSLANAPANDPKLNTSLTVRLLKEFGDVRVLSSPTVMAINNQTAVFRVVENRVFFTATGTVVQGTNGTPAVSTFETTPHTLPVGLTLTVTPQVSGDDQVTLIVRPTISREIGTGVRDPNPSLGDLASFVPETAVREMESVLRLQSGQIAALGGLMQDETTDDTSAVPVVSEVDGIGELFKNRDQNFVKTELVIFLKPTVIRSPSVDGDLQSFRRMLPANLRPAKAQPTFGLPYEGKKEAKPK